MKALLVEDNATDVTLFKMALATLPAPIELSVTGDGERALEFLYTKARGAVHGRPVRESGGGGPAGSRVVPARALLRRRDGPRRLGRHRHGGPGGGARARAPACERGGGPRSSADEPASGDPAVRDRDRARGH